MLRRISAQQERGAVTAETAVVLPLIAALAVGFTWMVSLGVTQMRAVDAAREVARAAARGDDPTEAKALGRRIAPKASRITVDAGEEAITVRVRARVQGPAGVFANLGSWMVKAQAIAAVEQRNGQP